MSWDTRQMFYVSLEITGMRVFLHKNAVMLLNKTVGKKSETTIQCKKN